MLRMILGIFVSLFSYVSFANVQMCLHARQVDGIPDSGHLSVYIRQAGAITHSYGYFPSGLAVNDPGDHPITRNEDQVRYADSYGDRTGTFRSSEFCQPIHKDQIPLIDLEAKSYKENHGRYQALTNNCVHFARHLYNKFTNDHLHFLVPAPANVIETMNAAKARGGTKLIDHSYDWLGQPVKDNLGVATASE